jgi:hypothetical protein
LDLSVRGDISLKLLCFEGESTRTKHQSGVAFWVGGRLVGEPGWIVGGIPVHDGRTKSGRRLTFLVQTENLREEVLPDWTGFKRSDVMNEVFGTLIPAILSILRDVLKERIDDTRCDVLAQSRGKIVTLSGVDQLEITEVIEMVTERNPLMDATAISAAVECVVEAKHNRSTETLIKRILQLPLEDVEGLHRLLDEWTMRDALTVLDEIGRRIKIVEALQKLEYDQTVNELHTLHPLVTQARWLFGPEYESATYASKRHDSRGRKKSLRRPSASRCLPKSSEKTGPSVPARPHSMRRSNRGC